MCEKCRSAMGASASKAQQRQQQAAKAAAKTDKPYKPPAPAAANAKANGAKPPAANTSDPKASGKPGAAPGGSAPATPPPGSGTPREQAAADTKEAPPKAGEKLLSAAWSTDTARGGDTVELVVRLGPGVTEGTTVALEILEKQTGGGEKAVKTLEATASGGEARASWTYTLHEEHDGDPGKKWAEALPEYAFTAKLGEEKISSASTLHYKTTFELQLKEDGKPVTDEPAYVVKSARGQAREGKVAADGWIRIPDLPPGHYEIAIDGYDVTMAVDD